MFSKLAVSALAAATLASAGTLRPPKSSHSISFSDSVVIASSKSACTSSTFTIGTAAEATAIASCDTLKGDVVISSTSDNTLDLSGPTAIYGDLTVKNNGALINLQSTSLASVSGAFTLSNVTLLSTLSLPALTSVGSISFQSLPALNELTFTTGVNTADSVIISDTFLGTLDGIDLDSVGTMDINNNRRLTKFDSSLKNLSSNLNIQANGAELSVSLPNLSWIANMTIANVTEFSTPSLEVVNGSARFDSNYFTTFSAPNLTKADSGDISFINNPDLTNITFPALKSVGGGLTIVNNTALEEIDGFPKLSTVGGAVKLGGNFSL